jgi:hypothetical protein
MDSIEANEYNDIVFLENRNVYNQGFIVGDELKNVNFGEEVGGFYQEPRAVESTSQSLFWIKDVKKEEYERIQRMKNLIQAKYSSETERHLNELEATRQFEMVEFDASQKAGRAIEKKIATKDVNVAELTFNRLIREAGLEPPPFNKTIKKIKTAENRAREYIEDNMGGKKTRKSKAGRPSKADTERRKKSRTSIAVDVEEEVPVVEAPVDQFFGNEDDAMEEDPFQIEPLQ